MWSGSSSTRWRAGGARDTFPSSSDSRIRSIHGDRSAGVAAGGGLVEELGLVPDKVQIVVPHVHHHGEDRAVVGAGDKREHPHAMYTRVVLEQRELHHPPALVGGIQKLQPRAARVSDRGSNGDCTVQPDTERVPAEMEIVTMRVNRVPPAV